MKKILLVLFSFLLLITSGCGQNTDTPKENSAAAYVVTDCVRPPVAAWRW